MKASVRTASLCGVLLFGMFFSVTSSSQTIVTNIAWAKRDLDSNFFADDTNGSLYKVLGQIVSPNFATNRTEIYIQDTNDQVGILVIGEIFTVDPAVFRTGLMATARGQIFQNAGLRYIRPTLSSYFSITNVPATALAPLPMTISNLLANAETYEGTLVVISNAVLTNAVATWPEWNESGTMQITGTLTRLNVFVDRDTDIDGQLLPTNSFSLIGIFSQYDTTATPTGRYQVIPRYYSDLVQSSTPQPPGIHVVGSNDPVSVTVGEEVVINVVGQDRNAADALVLSAPTIPSGAVFSDGGDRHGTLTWTPGVETIGTTNVAEFEVTDGSTTNRSRLNIYVLNEELGNIVINEIHYDPASSIAGDANGDGTRDAVQDEFVEIYNANTGSVDMTGWVLRMGTNLLFTFPSTTLSGKCAVVVFGGGTPVGLFGGATVYSGWAGGRTLPNTAGDQALALLTSGGVPVQTYNYGSFGSSPDQSVTRDPDITGNFSLHTDANPILLYSPGTYATGKPFDGSPVTNSAPLIYPILSSVAQVGRTLTLQVEATDAETNAISLSVSNAPATATFTSNGYGMAIFCYTGQAAHAGMSYTVTVHAADGVTNSQRSFGLYVPETKYSGLVINEYLPDPDASGGIAIDSNNDGVYPTNGDEFVEIVNFSTNTINLAGFMLYDADQLRHTFSSVNLPTGSAVIVFGGGSIANFSNCPAQIASSGTLSLNNDADSVIFYSPQTNLIDRSDYDVGLSGISWTRFPDATGTFTDHIAAALSRASPGLRTDGTLFLTNLPAISITNPVGEATTVVYAVSTYSLQGTANPYTAGHLRWTNSLTAGSGISAVATNWTISGIPLGVGTNGVAVTATNTGGSSVSRSVTIIREAFFLGTSVVQAATGVVENAFYANWTAATGADGYFLDVATNDSFSGQVGGEGDELWINEIHYDNNVADTNEGVEVAGPAGTSLGAYSIIAYNGNGGALYYSNTLSGTVDDEGGGFGAVWFAITGLQNGASDGVALVKSGVVVQFLSYEGVLTAANGPAAGMTSVDIGVSESEATAVGQSLQLTGAGNAYSNFTWTGPVTASTGTINSGQTILGSSGNTFVPGYQNRDVGNVLTFAVTGLTEGVTYYYRVRPYGNSLTGVYSSVTSVLTQATSNDSDGDGMANDWEALWFGGPTNATASADDDGDGDDNLTEYLADTIPVNPLGSNSYFEVQSIAGGDARRVTFVSSTGRVYTFQYSDDVKAGDAWSNLQTDVTGTNTTTTLTDTNTPVEDRAYRVRVRIP